MSDADPHPTTILVVDDDPQHRVLIAQALKRAGYHVVEAATGELALEMLREPARSIDWLYTDIRLPGADGWLVADAFHLAHPTRPVIYASGHPSDRRRCVPGSMFFAKPAHLPDLVRAFQDLSRRAPEEPVAFRLNPEPPHPRRGPLGYRAYEDGLDIGWT